MKLNIIKPFRSNKRQVRRAFKAVKEDFRALETEHFALKHSTDEWIRFLSERNSELALRVEALERKLTEYGASGDNEELEVLRTI